MQTNYDYVGFQVATKIQLGNLANEVITLTTTNRSEVQSKIRVLIGGLLSSTTGKVPSNLSIPTYFAACTLNATSSDLYLPMQNGRTAETLSPSFDPQSDPWSIWSQSPTTELTRIVCNNLFILYYRSAN